MIGVACIILNISKKVDTEGIIVVAILQVRIANIGRPRVHTDGRYTEVQRVGGFGERSRDIKAGLAPALASWLMPSLTQKNDALASSRQFLC